MCGLKIDFILELFLEKVSTYPKISAQEFLLVTKEVESMLKKGAIQKTSVEKCQFLSKLFLVVRKNGGSRPVISIKNMNASILYLYFKMEGLHLLKFMLKVKNYMCKIELKNAYICNPLHWQHQKYIRFCWEGQFYEFVYPCFGLGQAPRFLTKLLKISIAKNQYSNHCLLGRYVFDEPNNRKSEHGKGHIDFSLSLIGVHNKSVSK